MNASAKPRLTVPATDVSGMLSGAPKRVYDPRIGMYSVRLQPGECYATAASDETIVTVLGSCVAACIRDPRTGFGGMNHFMLPESETGEWSGVSAALRYGNHAMEMLINAVLKTGCARQYMEIKLFGGSNLNEGPSKVGSKNASFALSYLKNEGLTALVTDLGGTHPRVIHYVPSTGAARRIFRKRIEEDQIIVESERRYKAKLNVPPASEGDVELFD
jgi:chemotaxis protein CheD